MRIAVIAPPWLPVPPTGYGGTEVVLDTLCRGLAAADHDVLLYATGDSTCPVELAWTFPEHLGTVAISPAAELAHVMDAYDTALGWGAEVIHDHTITGPVWAGVHGRCPVVTTNHGPFSGDLAAVYRRIGPHLPIIAISHHQASTAGAIPIYAVIHHGVDLTGVEPGTGTGGYAAFLGRMTPDKGVDRAIRIARRAGVALRIAAKMREPAEQAYFDATVRPLLGGDVEYLGELRGDDKHRLLADATCLLNPIAWPEPFGMVMIEALARGTPVVATPYGAAPEIIGDGVTGWLRRDDDQLARAVLTAASLDRTACRAAAQTRFSMERMVTDHTSIYAALAATTRAHDAELVSVLDGDAPPDRAELVNISPTDTAL
ncbi:MAG: glycosyltransferase family 4 protein [Actinomycetota bacterium]|jgi:glycosyltransferase involved in cell wall biosynthesis